MDLSSSGPEAFRSGTVPIDPAAVRAEEMLALLIHDLCDGVDHPEVWSAFPQFLKQVPGLTRAMQSNLDLLRAPQVEVRLAFTILLAIRLAVSGDHAGALEALADLSIRHNESPLVQGAIFHVESLAAPDHPKFDLSAKFCPRPFEEIDVLEGSTHLCCANWLGLSTGDLAGADQWQDVWNSTNAERIRASIHDGSYRHCNKTACPVIQTGELPTRAQVAERSPRWKAIVDEKQTRLADGPEKVNLAYDKTCNLACPSCRTEPFAADSATRDRFERLQEKSILPMLRDARSVYITGSGDPFASKNFRSLMERLDADGYPDLRFIVMTNGMLFNQREWERFPALHERVQSLHISIDAASKQTHELLRRGARWEVMLENMRFAADLLEQGRIGGLCLQFTVQTENYREMADAVDLARGLDDCRIYFGRMTNWGTFSTEGYQEKAVFLKSHPQHQDFLEAMRDPRLRDPRVIIGNLVEFLPAE